MSERQPPYTIYTVPYDVLATMPYEEYVKLPSQLPEQPNKEQEDIEQEDDRQ
jgi:hypothetical protein